MSTIKENLSSFAIRILRGRPIDGRTPADSGTLGGSFEGIGSTL